MYENGACAFTGHRQIPTAHKASLPDILARAIAYAYSKGCRRFLTGGAIGFDTVAAREIIRFRLAHPDISLVLILPCLQQDATWSASQRDSYHFTLSSADEVVYVSDDYTPSCMRKRNQQLAESCDILIAYIFRNHSGAAQTARMAEKLGKETYNVYHELERTSR